MKRSQRIGKTHADSEVSWPNELARDPVKQPNVVVIVLDDVGFGQIGCYGSTIRTPNIDALAQSGIRYSSFHTTSLCSPTRAALLTGRNHHSNGMACIPQLVQGYPGYNGIMPAKNGMLSEHLVRNGYNTFAVGKWHLVPDYEISAAGPYDRWPLGRGFERYYGFLTGMTDHWHPGSLVRDNQFVDVHGGDGYHLSVNLTEQAVQYVADVHTAAPHKPFFLYLAYGAGHSPHHVPYEYADAYKGEFDAGWDKERERVLARQKQLGMMSESVQLPPRNHGVEAWDTLSDDQKRVYARMQEVFAGFMTHTDEQIGRVTAFLKKIDRFDDTIIIFMSDNGASTEGGTDGRLNEYALYNGVPQSFDQLVANIDKIGGPDFINHYPRGWAMAGNTPFREWKRSTYQGGIADPLIISWPDQISDGGAIRDQYHHVIDIFPTIFEALGLEPEPTIAGVNQSEIEGVSMLYSMRDPAAPTRKHTQYYEMLGSRAIYHDGWKAVADHEPMSGVGHFDQDRWELFFLPDDPNETEDLSQTYPERVRDLVDRWWIEAGKYKVLPIDDRGHERWADPRPRVEPARQFYVYLPDTQPIFERSAVNVINRDFEITARFGQADETPIEGVIIAHGNRFGGYTFFVQNGVLNFVYNFCGDQGHRVSAPLDGNRQIVAKVVFRKTGDYRGDLQLWIDGREASTCYIPEMIPRILPLHSSLNCGTDRGLSVCSDYESPFRFTGKLDEVVVSVGEAASEDTEVMMAAAFSAQ